MTKKQELLEEAKKLDLDVTDKNTIAEITEAIKNVGNQEESSATDDKTFAKAGKRSEKSVKEAEKKQAKEERKASDEEPAPKPKKAVKPTRSRLERRAKAYKKASELIDKNKEYTTSEAIDILIKTASTKFDSTAELHIRLNVDPRHADQNIRDNIVLPAGTGKSVRVAVFANEDQIAKAGKLDVVLSGEDEVINKLKKEEINFDVLIATPNMMQSLAKFARLLGPKGLMPNPKSGTVTNDIAKAVNEAKAGRVEYRVDSTGIVHVGFGKISFGKDKLSQNLSALTESIKSNKPSSVKGAYVRSIYLTTTMGPSIKLDNTAV